MAITRQGAIVNNYSATARASITQSITIAAGSNRALAVRVSCEEAGTTISGVTYNAVALTGLTAAASATWSKSQIWYMVAPAVGTFDVVVSTSSGSRVMGCTIEILEGVDQTTPVGAVSNDANATALDAAVSATVAGVAIDGYIVDQLTVDGGAKVTTPGANQTAVSVAQDLADTACHGSVQSGVDGGVMSWTWTGGNAEAALTAVEFKAAAGGAVPQDIVATLTGAGSLTAGISAGVTYMGGGTAATALSGDVTANYPTGAGAPLVDDIIICDVSSRDNVSLTFPGGWTKKAEANNGTGLRQTIAYHRRAGGESETSVAITHTAGAQIIARAHVIRGAVGSGDPFEAATGPTTVTAGTTGTFPSVTTLSAGDLLFYALAYQEDYLTAPTITNAQSLTLTERDLTEIT